MLQRSGCIGVSAITAIRSASSHGDLRVEPPLRRSSPPLSHRLRRRARGDLSPGGARPTFVPILAAVRRVPQAGNGGRGCAGVCLPSQPITPAWRRENVLAPVRLRLEGGICDLTDVTQRQGVEEQHVDLLLHHDMRHLNLHDITTNRRVVTQTVAAGIYDDGAAAILLLLPAPWMAILVSRSSGAWSA